MLTEQEKRRYDEQGFLMKPGLLAPEECDALLARVSETIARLAPETPVPPETPDSDYFRASARSIRIFWEKGTDPGALPPAARERAVSRLGHGLHWVDETFRRAACHPRVAEVLEALIGLGVNVVQSMLIYKQPRVGGELGFHQDAQYLHTEPNTLIAAWMALDDVGVENSPLLVIPGSHRLPLHAISEMDAQGKFHERALSDVRPDPGAAIPVPAPRGAVIFFHGLLYHGSGPNESPRPRRAYAVHYASAASRWSPFNWIDAAPGFIPVR